MTRRVSRFLLVLSCAAAGLASAADAKPSRDKAKAAAYAQACREYQLNGEFAKALESCGVCLELDPGRGECETFESFSQESLTRQKQRNSEIAERLADNLRRKVPKPAAPDRDERAAQQHYLSGVVYFQKGDLKKAREEWNVCLGLDPANEDCRAGLKNLAEREKED